MPHGPWVDIHAHPGRCFLGGLDPAAPMVQLLGADDGPQRVLTAQSAGVAAVNASTVGDLVVLGLTPKGGLAATREFEPGEAEADHTRQLAALAALVGAPGIQAVLGPEDIQGALDANLPGVFIGCEGADFLDSRLDGLAPAYQMGVRAITLVHYRLNELGDVQTEDPEHDGLTQFGKEVITEMNRLGMIVDMAHASFKTTVDALEVSTKPVMISHSHLASPGANHPRLLSEEHALAVCDAGGLIGAWPSGVTATSLEDYCDEICRLVDLVGIDHVAVGTDLDANYKPVLTNYGQFPEVAALLGNRGMTAGEVDRVLGGNFISLFQSVSEAGA